MLVRDAPTFSNAPRARGALESAEDITTKEGKTMPTIGKKATPAPRQDDRLLFAMYDAERAERATIGATDKLADRLDDHDKTIASLDDEIVTLQERIETLTIALEKSTEMVERLAAVLESIDDRQAEQLAK